MDKVVIITGASKGLGKAITDSVLLRNDTIVVSISRSIHNDHIVFKNKRFHFIKTDLSKPFKINSFKILKKLINQNSQIFIFNNASVILPINKVGNFSSFDINYSININIKFPVSLINYMIHTFYTNNINFINITSGAANKPIAFWSLYSSCKSYMELFFNVLKKENKEVNNLSFISIDPGTLDTEMQNKIRTNKFPDQDFFLNLKSSNELVKPAFAAKNILERIKFSS